MNAVQMMDGVKLYKKERRFDDPPLRIREQRWIPQGMLLKK